MHNKMAAVAICMAAFAMSAAAQVTGSGTAGTVPVFTGSGTSIGNSSAPITVSSTGNVGIGNTNPNNLLELSGGAFDFYNPGNWVAVGMDYDPTTDALRLRSNNASSNLNQTDISVQRVSGNVGIGTTAPTAILTIRKDAGTGNPMSTPAAMIDFKAYYTGYDTETVKASIRSGVDGTAVWNTQSGFLAFDTANTGTLNEAMRISALGNVGIGTTAPAYNLDVTGQIRATTGYVFPDGTTQTTAFIPANCGADYAESVGVTGDRTSFTPGDLLVIDPNNPGSFLKSNQPYSTLIAGVYSTKPGFVGRLEPASAKTDATEVPMAMVGRVPAKVSAENGPIKVGDLLVSSSTVGYAMKGTDRSLLTGAVIGKALGSLDSGTGTILVLVTLQ